MNISSSTMGYSEEQYQKEMAELRREKALQYALDRYRTSGDAASLWNVSQLITDAAIIEKYLKDGK